MYIVKQNYLKNLSIKSDIMYIQQMVKVTSRISKNLLEQLKALANEQFRSVAKTL